MLYDVSLVHFQFSNAQNYPSVEPNQCEPMISDFQNALPVLQKEEPKDDKIKIIAVGHRIQSRRIELGWSVEYLAKKIDVSANTVLNWEVGCSRLPKQKARKLSQVMGLRHSDLQPDHQMKWIEIGDRIRELRIKKGLFQADLAKKVGIATQSLCAYELGQKNPRCIIEKTAKALDVTPEDIVRTPKVLEEKEPEKKEMSPPKPLSHTKLIIDEERIRIGQVIKKRREELNMSFDDLARESGVSATTIFNNELGCVAKLRHPAELAQALSLSAKDLIAKNAKSPSKPAPLAKQLRLEKVVNIVELPDSSQPSVSSWQQYLPVKTSRGEKLTKAPGVSPKDIILQQKRKKVWEFHNNF
jgi:transcriptional regulator with XRE-family HTH domain